MVTINVDPNLLIYIFILNIVFNLGICLYTFFKIYIKQMSLDNFFLKVNLLLFESMIFLLQSYISEISTHFKYVIMNKNNYIIENIDVEVYQI